MEKNKENEIDKLFENLPKDEKAEADVFGDKKPTEPEKEPEVKKDSEENPETEPHKNRRHRRLESQLQQEREARIRAEAIAEANLKNSIKEDTGDVDPRWLQIYGDTAESRLAWKLQKELFDSQAGKIREQTLAEIKKEQQEAEKEQKVHEQFIESELEALEDEFNIDLTSSAPKATKLRREFLEMVESLSPKDKDGDIVDYADFGAAWGLFQKNIPSDKPDASRNKEIAAKSMANGSSTPTSEREITPGFRGWQKDYNL